MTDARRGVLAAKINVQKTVKVIQTIRMMKWKHPPLPLANMTSFADLYIGASLRCQSSQVNCIFGKADQHGIEFCTSPVKEMNLQEAVIYLSSRRRYGNNSVTSGQNLFTLSQCYYYQIFV